MELNHQPAEANDHTLLPTIQETEEVQVPQESIPIVESETVTKLLVMADRENAARRTIPFVAIPLAAAYGLIAAFHQRPIPSFFFSLVVVAFSYFALLFTIMSRSTTAALAAVEDVRMIGPLLDRLRANRRGRRTRRVVRQALTRLLPRVRASDAALLTKDQQAHLSRILAQLALFKRDPDLQLAILSAFQQIGGSQTVPVVESLAKMQPRTAAQTRVQEAAKECLPFLLQRVAQENSRETLLRATSSVSADTSQLLRANERDEGEEQTPLMRAVQVGDITLVKMLLAHKADVQLQDDEGNTALMFAAQNGNYQIVNLFLENGAAIGTRNSTGETAMTMARTKKRLAIAKMLNPRIEKQVLEAARIPMKVAANTATLAHR